MCHDMPYEVFEMQNLTVYTDREKLFCKFSYSLELLLTFISVNNQSEKLFQITDQIFFRPSMTQCCHMATIAKMVSF